MSYEEISDLSQFCVVCLSNQNIKCPLSRILNKKQGSATIYDSLCLVLNKTISNHDLYPNHICTNCITYLKFAIKLNVKYNKSEKILENYFEVRNGIPIVEIMSTDRNFDVQDLLAVENENEQNEGENFERYLQNLDTEVSSDYADQDNRTESNPNELKEEIILIKSVPSEAENVLDCTNRIEVTEGEEKSNEIEEEIILINETCLDDSVQSKADEEEVDRCEYAIKEERILKNRLKKTTCEFCKKRFRNSGNLTRHKAQFHSTEKETLLCQVCGFLAKSKSVLYNHFNLKHKEKKHVCSICGKKYNTSQSLKVHLDVHENKRQYLCTTCGKGFNYSVSLEYHMRIHTGEKKYKCTYCDKSFSMRSSLNRHLRTHTGARPYKCQFCDRSLRSKGELDCHEWTHTGYRPYHCKHCNKGFTKTHNLKMHMLGHKGPHECEVCHRGFLEVNYLKLHMKLSHNMVE